MKVLSIGSDKKLFDGSSPVAVRNADYGRGMEELHIVVFSLASKGLKEKKLSGNVTAYPTNSFSKIFYIWDAIRLGKNIIRQNKFVRGNSVITCQDPFESGFAGWRISKKFSLPLHLQIHTDFLSPYFKTSLLQRFRVALAKFLLPKASAVRVVSKRIADSMEKAGIHLTRKAEILPIFVDKTALESKNSGANLKEMFPQFKFIILMASRLSEEKRISDAISAFAEVLKKYPQTGLVIAGDGTLRKNLEEKAKKLSIQKSVIFLGWRDDVYTLMKSANMFLSASAYEGYGMSVIEAGLAGCPVLTTDAGLSGDILVHKKNSYICPVNDIMCLRDFILEFIENNESRLILSQILASDIASATPSKEEYVRRYVDSLRSALNK